MPRLHRPGSVAELLAAASNAGWSATEDDRVYVRCQLGDPARGRGAASSTSGAWSTSGTSGTQVHAWAGRDALVVLRERPSSPRPRWLLALGEPPAVATLVPEVLADAPPVSGLTLPRRTLELLPAPVRPPAYEDWDFFWTGQPLAPVPGQDRVGELGEDAEGEVLALLEGHSPRHSTTPGSPYVRRWCGVRDPAGALLACGAHVEYVPGIAHLASIATCTDARGRGWGAAVTAELVRRALVDSELVWLGMYADNEPARRVYRRLGLRDSHQLSSGQLPGAS